MTIIIRKTKRSEKIKRSVSPRKTKRSFFRFPTTPQRKTPQVSLGRFAVYSLYISDIQRRASHSHHHQATTIVQTVLECNSSNVRIKHDVRIGRIVIHVGIELSAVAIFKGVANKLISTYPFTQLYYGRLVRGEVNEPMSGKNGQHIKVVRQLPVHLVGRAIRAQVRRVDQEHDTRHVLVLLKYLPVVTGGNGQPVEIATA